MPIRKCGNGKYRIGDGPCMYNSKEKATRAYQAYLAKEHSEGSLNMLPKKMGEKIIVKAQDKPAKLDKSVAKYQKALPPAVWEKIVKWFDKEPIKIKSATKISFAKNLAEFYRIEDADGTLSIYDEDGLYVTDGQYGFKDPMYAKEIANFVLDPKNKPTYKKL